MSEIKSKRWKDELLVFFKKYTVIPVLFAFIILAAILSNNFFTGSNISNVLRQITANGIIALGMTFAIMTGGIDISVGSTVGFASLMFTSCFQPNDLQSPFNRIVAAISRILPDDKVFCIVIAGLFTLLLCAVIGLINGIGIAKLGLPEFIMTMSTLTVVKGITLVLCDGRSVYLERSYGDRIGWLGSGRLLGIPVPVIVLVILFGISILVLNKTTYGRYVRAIGANGEAARLAGINVVKYRASVYVITAVMSGLAGIVISCRTLSGEPLLGDGYELDAIAGTVIGGTALTGGVGNTIGTIFGVLIIGVLNNMLNLLNVSSYFQYIVKGVIIFIAVLIRTERKKV